MQLKTIRQGSRGPLVRRWQDFLRGQDVYLGISDGKFGPYTTAATKRYQTSESLHADGIVGNTAWGHAMADGLHLVEDTDKSKAGPNWPPPPKGFKQASRASRYKLFGKFDYLPAPTKNNPEGIRILGSWQKDNLVRVVVPQLKGIYGAPKSGRIFWHKAAVDQLKGMFQEWEDEGLLDLVLGWAGSWNPRFIRGSRSVLSNHAWATALDINVPWNGLGRRPALLNHHGTVRPLVPIANKWGFWWGGFWGYPNRPGGPGRSDGMHFECAKLL